MDFENETKSHYYHVVDSVLGVEFGQHAEIRSRIQSALATALAIRSHDLFKEILAKFYVKMGHDMKEQLKENSTATAMVFPEEIVESERLLFESLKTGSAAGFDELQRRGVISDEDRKAISVNID